MNKYFIIAFGVCTASYTLGRAAGELLLLATAPTITAIASISIILLLLYWWHSE